MSFKEDYMKEKHVAGKKIPRVLGKIDHIARIAGVSYIPANNHFSAW